MGNAGLQSEVGMCLSDIEEHIPDCSFLERSFVEGRDLLVWKRQEETFGYSCPLLVCWFPVTKQRMNRVI